MMRKAVDSTWTLEVNNNTFVKGQRVKLRREPLKGLEGIVTDVSSKKVHLVLPAIGVTLVVDLEHADFDYL
jgi:transcription antitermination factor NusG